MDDEIEMNNFVLESAPKEGHCVALNDVHSSKKEDSLTLSYGGPQTGSRTTKNLSSGDWSYRHTKSSVSLTAKSRTTRWRSHGRRSTFANTRGSALNQEVRISKESTEMKLKRIEAFFYNQGMEIALSALYLSMNLLVRGHGAYQFTVCWRMVGDPKLCTLVVDTSCPSTIELWPSQSFFWLYRPHPSPDRQLRKPIDGGCRHRDQVLWPQKIRCRLSRYGFGRTGVLLYVEMRGPARDPILCAAKGFGDRCRQFWQVAWCPLAPCPPLILGGDSLRDAAKTWDTRCLRVELLLYVSFR